MTKGYWPIAKQCSWLYPPKCCYLHPMCVIYVSFSFSFWMVETHFTSPSFVMIPSPDFSCFPRFFWQSHTSNRIRPVGHPCWSNVHVSCYATNWAGLFIHLLMNSTCMLYRSNFSLGKLSCLLTNTGIKTLASRQIGIGDTLPSQSHMLHVWNIYQHLPHKWSKCR